MIIRRTHAVVILFLESTSTNTTGADVDTRATPAATSATSATSAITRDSLTSTNLSPGCFTIDPPHSAGDQWDDDVTYDGEDYNHFFSLPENYVHNPGDGTNFDNDTGKGSGPTPLLLFFHGWGGSSRDCRTTCSTAHDRGYATISLTGMGGENGDFNSWRGFGSVSSGTGSASFPENAQSAPEDTCGKESGEENDRTCNTDAYSVGCYKDCNGECIDGCWWTTCRDSVEQTVQVLELFLESYCIDLRRIYAVGSSNGGMFTYELARDERTARYLAGIAPQVGLPHYGYNFGPNVNFGTVHHFGFWGESDEVVPPNEGPSSGTDCQVECRTSEIQGWFYTDAKCVTKKWAEAWGLDEGSSHEMYGIPDQKQVTECWSYSKSSGDSSNDAIVIGCYFDGGHDYNGDFMNEITLNFFDVHYKNLHSAGDQSLHPSENASSNVPSMSLSDKPSLFSSTHPSLSASNEPSISSSNEPSISISNEQPISASNSPSISSSMKPSIFPSNEPSVTPSMYSSNPSISPSNISSSMPSIFSFIQPSVQPSIHPSSEPSSISSVANGTENTFIPPATAPPSVVMTNEPSFSPSNSMQRPFAPSTGPSLGPTQEPMVNISHSPVVPSGNPTVDDGADIESTPPPTFQPSLSPSIPSTADPTRGNDPTSGLLDGSVDEQNGIKSEGYFSHIFRIVGLMGYLLLAWW